MLFICCGPCNWIQSVSLHMMNRTQWPQHLMLVFRSKGGAMLSMRDFCQELTMQAVAVGQNSCTIRRL